MVRAEHAPSSPPGSSPVVSHRTRLQRAAVRHVAKPLMGDPRRAAVDVGRPAPGAHVAAVDDAGVDAQARSSRPVGPAGMQMRPGEAEQIAGLDDHRQRRRGVGVERRLAFGQQG